jgi:hypothetical protein
VFSGFGSIEGASGVIRTVHGKAVVPTGIYQVQGGRPVRLDAPAED